MCNSALVLGGFCWFAGDLHFIPRIPQCHCPFFWSFGLYICLPPWPVEKYSLWPSPQRYFLCMFFPCAFCPRTPRHWRACIRTVSLWIWNQLHFLIQIPPAPRLTLIPLTEFFYSWWVFSLSSFPVHLSSGLRAIHLTGMCLAWSSLLSALQGFP